MDGFSNPDIAAALSLPDDVAHQDRFAEILVRGVISHLSYLDDLIKRCSTNWKIERMTYLDRNILRIAAFEMCFLPEIPEPVSINEAIEISKIYGSEQSSRFINGVLNRIKDEIAASKEAKSSNE
jgi:N utilization substance protein B